LKPHTAADARGTCCFGGLTRPGALVRKLVEIANAVDAVQDGSIFVELVNRPFLDASGTPINAASHWRATALGWLSRHESWTYVNFTPAGAEMFA
jgi:hypothetical protein